MKDIDTKKKTQNQRLHLIPLSCVSSVWQDNVSFLLFKVMYA